MYEILTIRETIRLTQFCENERTQILIMVPLARTNAFIAGKVIIGNRVNFVHIEILRCGLGMPTLPLRSETHKENCFNKVRFCHQDILY